MPTIPFASDLDYSILINIATVLVLAAASRAVAAWIFRRQLASVASSERRTALAFLRSAVTGMIMFGAAVAIAYAIPPLRSIAVGMFAGAGILAAIVGFASQAAFSNIVSGVFIVLFKPFRVGDIVKINGEIGTVEDITLRQTVIRALENKRLIYPNSLIDSEPIINWSIQDERAQKYMYISVSFDADVDLAARIIREEAERHPSLLDLRTDEERQGGTPLVETPILNFDGSMVNFRIPLWAKDLPTAMRMTWDLHRVIHDRFTQNHIPFGRPPRENYERAIREDS
ncbi:MAG: mechanosensitive ion channel [Bryobacterales bacterium]|nr:mechanosensitive ion channel [Bryobacterales bacterium]